MIHATEADIRRFMSFVDILPNGCWPWIGARSRGSGNKKWYGSFRIGKRVVRAHRFSSEVFNGDDCPPDHDRDHTCCFSLCVNPDHIIVIPKLENSRLKFSRRKELEGKESVITRLVTSHQYRMKYLEVA